jgi:hypothetical protein
MKPNTKTLITRISHTLFISSVIMGTSLLTNCAVPATSSMSLGSISSISGSSASSAANQHNHKSAYYFDVRESTAAAIIAQASASEVQRSISRAATQHGISDWEAEQGSYVALGEGLRLGGLNEDQANSWIAQLSNGNEKTARLIKQGYLNS